MLLLSIIAAGAFLAWNPSNDAAKTGVGVVVALCLIASLVAFIMRYFSWRTTHFVVTTERCIYRSGIAKKSGIEIPLERINTVFFSQTLFERLLKAGDLGIESAGEGSRQSFSDIKNPLHVQNLIYMQMEDNENRKYSRIGDEARLAAVGASGLSVAEQLEKLSSLRDSGVLSPEEFEQQKAALLRQ